MHLRTAPVLRGRRDAAIATIRIVCFNPTSLNPGQRIGPFEIVSLLGRGGMGEVFLANDTRLNRRVAIKLLPAEFASDRQRLCRFEQEAKTLASLDHPNILSIFEVGTHEGTPYLVSQFLEGNTLREELDHGALPQRKAVDYALQIAKGLAAAHAKGIVHRDLKPENIFITKDGRVKILDFGLAKLRERTGQSFNSISNGAQRPTSDFQGSDAQEGEELTLVQTTEPGVVLGTVGYMSPEQVRGENADHRSDFFAFGCILHEMLTGWRAFRKETAAETMTAILKEEPPELPPDSPPGLLRLERIARRCLEKEPDRRFQSAHDLAFALEELSASNITARAPLPGWKPRQIERIAWGCLALVLLGFVLVHRSRIASSPQSTPVAPLFRSAILLPDNAPLALAKSESLTGWDRLVVDISPDGQHVVYVAKNGSGTQLFLRSMNETEAVPLPATEGAIHPFFSPDGLWIGFATHQRVQKYSLRSKAVEPISMLEFEVVRATWVNEDWIYLSGGGKLHRVHSETGRAETIGELGRRLNRVSQVLPDGKSFLFASREGGISGDYAQLCLISLETGQTNVLGLRGYDARFVPGGYIVFAREGRLLASRFDVEQQKIIAEPKELASGVAMQSLMDQAQFAISESGHLVYVRGGDLAVGRVAKVSRNEEVEFVPNMQDRVYGSLRVSPDDQQLAIQVADVQDRIDIYDLAGNQPERTVSSARNVGWPVWSPDGTELAYTSSAPGEWKILVQAVRPIFREPGEIFTSTTSWATPNTWSKDGLLGCTVEGILEMDQSNRVSQVVFIDVNSQQYRETAAWQLEDPFFPMFSPDGRWVTYVATKNTAYNVMVQSVSNPEESHQISTGGAIEPFWARSGELFFRRGTIWWVTTFDPETTSWTPLRQVWKTDFIDTPGLSYNVSSDGTTLFVVKKTRSVDTQSIHLVQNWAETLKPQR